MKFLPFILLLLTAVLIGMATWVENACGTAFIRDYVYGTTWFILWWSAVWAASAALIIQRKMWKNLPALLLHLSFFVIFAGALITTLTSRKGMLHLRKDHPTEEYTAMRQKTERLPFTVQLDSFRVAFYPGTDTPADYISHLTFRQNSGEAFARPVISMNRIFSTQGYRFYQSSYDEDMKGSWLSVNYDPWGTAVTYTGFCMLCLGWLLVLLHRYGEFRMLCRHPLIKKSGLLLLVSFIGAELQAGTPLPVIRKTQADSLTRQQVVYNGRIAPLNTPARDFMQKIYGRATFRSLTPEQVICSWKLWPEEWNRVPFIRIKNTELRHALKLEKEYASLNDLFDGPQYKLQPLWQNLKDKHGKLARAIQDTDEKTALILMLKQGTLFRPLTADVPPLSRQRINAELLYNRIPFSKILFMANLALGIAAFGLLLRRMLTHRRESRTSRRIWSAALYLSTLFHISGYALRGYLSSSLPLSNGYETMLFVALAILATSCILQHRYPFTRPSGLLLSGLTLLTAHLCAMNPQITPLIPVLASPWLRWHVSFIMISYALYAFTCLNALIALCIIPNRHATVSPARREQITQLTLLSRLLSYPATFLLGTGILMGAVWANVSWGSYWSWDPKEVWALVAFMAYGVTFHRQSLPLLHHPRAYHTYMAAAFTVILITFFGVNYLLGGMHSYAGN